MPILVNGLSIDYSDLPSHMQEGMRRYIEHRIPPGSFLSAVLCNDLCEAADRADDINRHMLYEYVQWLYNHAPAGCWGSVETFESYLKGQT